MKQFIKIIKTHLVVPSLGFAFLFSIFDVIVDVYIFKEGTIKTHLLSPQPLEIYYRSFVALMFITFGFIGQKMAQRRKKAEETLKVAEDKFKIIAENTYDWEFWTGPDHKFIFTSPSALRVTGYSPEKFSQDPDFLDSIIYPEDMPLYDQHRKEAESEHGLHEVEFRINHADGSVRWISHACQPVTGSNGEHLGIRGNNRDITARKKLQLEKEISEAKYSSLFSSMLNGFAWHKIIVDENHRPVDYEYLEVNNAFEKMTGLNRKDVLFKRVSEVIPELKNDDFDWIGTYGRVALNDEKIQFEQYSKAFGKWYNVTAYSPAHGEFATVFEDITERKKIERVNWENQERMDVIFNSIQAGIVVIDRETHSIAYVNQMAAKMIGAPQDEIMDHPCHKFICPAQAGSCPITDLGQTVDNSEKCLLTVAGEKIPILKTVVEEELAGRKVLVESFVDISEHKRIEEEREKIRLWQTGVNGILEAVLAPVSLEQKMKIVTDGIVETFGADFCRIWLIEKGDMCNGDCMHAESVDESHICKYRDKCLHLKASSGRYTHINGKGHRRVPFGVYKIGRIASGEDKKFLTNDVAHDPRVHNNEWAKGLGLVSFAGYQLKPPDGDVLGVFALFAGFTISPDMDKILEGLSRAISLAIQKDIADKALQYKNVLLSTQQEASIEGILIVGENDEIVSYNGRFTEMFDVPPEIIGNKDDAPLLEFVTGKQADPQAFLQRVQYLYAHKEEKSQDEIILNDGRTFDRYSAPMAGSNGKYYGRVWYFRDMTERKRAEETLRASEEKFRNLVENQSEGIGVTNGTEEFVFANSAANNIFGLGEGMLVGRSLKEFLTPESAQQVAEQTRQRKDGKRGNYELEIQVETGEKKIIYVSALPQTDSTGKFLGTMGLFQDITERKKQEKVIKEQALFFKTLVDTILTPVFYKDTEGKYLGCNKAFEELLGVPEDQIAGKTVFELTPPDKAVQYHKKDRELLENGGIQMYEYPVKSAKQGLREMQFNKSIFKDDMGNPKGIVGVMMDITERKKSEKLQAAIYHISEAAISSNNIETLFGEIHRTVAELISAKNIYIALYHEKEDMLSFPYFVDEADPAPQPRKLANGLTEYVLRSGTPLLASPMVLNLLIEQGKVSMVGTPSIDWAGVPLKAGNRMLGVLVVQSYQEDIRFGAEDLSMLNFVSDNIAQAIARKNDEEERIKLVSDLRKLSTAVEQSPSVIVITDLEGNIEYTNPAFEKTTGYARAEAIGQNPRILKSGELPSEEYRRLWETITAGNEWRGQFHNKRKDGSLYWEQATISGIKDAGGKIVKYLAVKEDITERKMMEDELRASEIQNRALVESAGRAGEAIVMLQNSGSIQVACLVANQEAVRITGYSQDELKRISWLDLVHPRFRDESQKRAQARLHSEDIPGIYEISLVSKYGVEIPIEVTGSPVQYQGRPAIVGFFREITERKQAEVEREAMITELKAALANIKQLKGLIPICASCKKIRNDGGYWQQVEEYVADHSEADFSHGLCDECAHNLYPDYFKDKKNKTEGEEVG
ncbi:PAS domain S-box protein [candidate division TA06 bacterium]|nr:PAS domain S-box protein [candidate division TA06 bacterium]